MIEAVAETNPDAILIRHIDPVDGITVGREFDESEPEGSLEDFLERAPAAAIAKDAAPV